ncbi:MAG: alanine racemase [Lachnospiraceae bacterium]|nr:alanine racemase [Lachnospiraceae bacterium]
MNKLTPRYVFSAERFAERVNYIAEMLPGIQLVYSMKANPFLLHCLPDKIEMVEVCSPGELSICEELSVPGRNILYSGVVKGYEDSVRALKEGARYLTAESIGQFDIVNKAAKDTGISAKVLLRISSGNQFGMCKEDLFSLIEREKDNPLLNIVGIHLFSGTSKRRVKAVEKDLNLLEEILTEAGNRFNFRAEIVEYGPGLGVDYFEETAEKSETTERSTLEEAAPFLMEFAAKYPLSIEMGRFMAAVSGFYETTVADIKTTEGVNYAMLDGGIHQLNYYGQNMAMKIPVILQTPDRPDSEKKTYCLCGSLCTTADVLVREVELKELSVGDVLRFERSGAYSVTEAPALFLSRDMPEIYIESKGEEKLLRERKSSYLINF